MVSVRFVRACRAGHVGDIDWYIFVHGGPKECRQQLWIDERGTSGDLSEVWIRCGCGDQRSIGEAALMQTQALGICNGARPWLGRDTREQCGEPNRLLIRTASNAYFPQLMSVISLPDRDETVKKAVDAAWEFVEEVEDIDQLRYERKKAKVKAALEGLSDEEVFNEILARRGAVLGETKSVKQAELETLMASKEEVGNDVPDGNFFARAVPRRSGMRPWMKSIERVVVVHRLREVMALVGFTRFEAASPDIEGELEIGVRRASLAREMSWLPAVENRGEGVFIQFKHADVEAWLQRPDVLQRAVRLNGRLRVLAETSTRAANASSPACLISCSIPSRTCWLRRWPWSVATRQVPSASASMPCPAPATESCSTRPPPTPRARSVDWLRQAAASKSISARRLEMGQLCSNDPGVCPA